MTFLPTGTLALWRWDGQPNSGFGPWNWFCLLILVFEKKQVCHVISVVTSCYCDRLLQRSLLVMLQFHLRKCMFYWDDLVPKSFLRSNTVLWDTSPISTVKTSTAAVSSVSFPYLVFPIGIFPYFPVFSRIFQYFPVFLVLLIYAIR